jgi:hypothetical protein
MCAVRKTDLAQRAALRVRSSSIDSPREMFDRSLHLRGGTNVKPRTARVDEVTLPARPVLRLTERDRMIIAQRMKSEPRQHFGFEFLLEQWFEESETRKRR